MKKSELKELIKECLIEDLNEEIDPKKVKSDKKKFNKAWKDLVKIEDQLAHDLLIDLADLDDYISSSKAKQVWKSFTTASSAVNKIKWILYEIK